MQDADDRTILEQLRTWTDAEADRCRQAFESRNRDGYVRECHGDLHLGNIALISGKVTLFDCIEFNPSMRWIDVMSDVRTQLTGVGISTAVVLDGRQALDLVPMIRPEAAVLHLSPSCVDVFRAIAGLRAADIARDIPILFMHGL